MSHIVFLVKNTPTDLQDDLLRDSHKSAKSAKQLIGFSFPSKASDTKLTKVRPASSLGKRTRSIPALNRDNSFDDEPDHKDQDEVIVEFSKGGAIKRGDKSGPLSRFSNQRVSNCMSNYSLYLSMKRGITSVQVASTYNTSDEAPPGS
ncbi:hypothetical protein K3495_g11867 [Podosphaera aphanis]|nr:hypothetical protein K3495_g11867 [Podosphaera aphanis]